MACRGTRDMFITVYIQILQHLQMKWTRIFHTQYNDWVRTGFPGFRFIVGVSGLFPLPPCSYSSDSSDLAIRSGLAIKTAANTESLYAGLIDYNMVSFSTENDAQKRQGYSSCSTAGLSGVTYAVQKGAEAGEMAET
jgi:hypothetical protein